VDEQAIRKRLEELAGILEQKYGYTKERLTQLITHDDDIPATVFSTDLSPLQAIVTFLHDHKHEAFNTIAQALHRSYRAVWGAYKEAGITIAPCKYSIPLDRFDDKHSILECVVKYLKEHYELKFTDIARELDKDPRTVWTAWDRARKKDARAS
jgi:hypothetical protein